jgi:hypothetical protein
MRGVALGRRSPPAPDRKVIVSGVRAARCPPPGFWLDPAAGDPPPTWRDINPGSGSLPALRRPMGRPSGRGSGTAWPVPPGSVRVSSSELPGKETSGRARDSRRGPGMPAPGASSWRLLPGPAGVPEPGAAGRGLHSGNSASGRARRAICTARGLAGACAGSALREAVSGTASCLRGAGAGGLGRGDVRAATGVFDTRRAEVSGCDGTERSRRGGLSESTVALAGAGLGSGAFFGASTATSITRALGGLRGGPCR